MSVSASSVAELPGLVRQVELLFEALDGATGEWQLAQLRKHVQALLQLLQQRVHELPGNLTQTTRVAADAIDDYVHERPWAAIATGLAVGMVAGAILAGRRAGAE